MSRLSLPQAIEVLEKEFEEAEDSFLLDRTHDLDDSEEFNDPELQEVSVPFPVIDPSTSDSCGDAEEVQIIQSKEDEDEVQEIERFIHETCGCKIGSSKRPCSHQFPKELISTYRSDCLQMSKEQLDFVILAQLSATRTHKDTIPATYRGDIANFRPHTSFLFRSIRICEAMFLFFHTISRSRFLNLCKHFDRFGIVERIHGNTKRLPPNTCTPPQLEELVKFIDNIADTHSMPLPGRLPNHRDQRVLLLPTDMTKAKIYHLYTTSCTVNNNPSVSRAKFYRVWSDIRPYVATMKPADDLCFDCQKLSTSLANSGHLTSEEKEQRVKEYSDHLNLAKQERTAYNQQIAECREAYQDTDPSSSESVTMHYSYDFAQQVHYPSNPLQPGPAYFLTARKCQIFGVACEPLGFQVNYLIDEADNTGKGANTTISLIHHFLEERTTCKSNAIFLHADNCIGQNKNNATMHYLLWRTLTGRQDSITLSFMISGHTKFAPDRHFGLIKRTYRRTRVETMGCLSDVVRNSSHIDANQVQLVRSLDGKQLVHFYDWTAFFQKYFVSIPSVTSYHVFHFEHQSPGKVFMKKFSNAPSKEIRLVRSSTLLPFPIEAFPEEIQPSGLTLERQWYLHDKIRPFCSSNLSADLTCPKPSAPQRVASHSNKRPPSQQGSSAVTSKRST
jgi:hypothetical protein